ncbi:Hypothetical protein PHPALM_1970 [Phytophthora palmivora]|uniref:PiggyBac transposable element-derived protein domain-containing protein n=1 Tax=Phytophthora palmivora TaxID=4796 RepID=A0A2P4YQX3_9STRA|nr:Hypothetical protein PHPALM_1970 [Phytophthora palmivora]
MTGSVSNEQDVEFGACDDDEEYPDDDDSDLPDIPFDNARLATVGGAAGLTVENLSKKQNAAILANMAQSGWLEAHGYPGLFDGSYGPSEEALAAATSPVNALFYFMTPRLWENMATASEDYFAEKMDARVTDQYNKKVQRERKKPGFQRQTREAIQAKMEQSPPTTGRDVCVFIGLLIARAIAPNKEKLQHHWETTDEGTIPRGCFGRFMTRDRFAHIAQNLHFSSNRDPRAVVDRAWKLRPVIDALQKTFLAGYKPPPIMAFDEAVLPSRSSFNRMRVYMKDKPHKYGTKLFMLCCSFETYLGKAGTVNGVSLRDERTGPVAVVRNLRAAFGDEQPNTMRLIVMDRFYTSIPLALELLTMGYYSVGTVMTDRKGLVVPDKNKKKKEQSRPTGIDRGTYTVADSSLVPGVTTTKCGLEEEVAYPRIVKDYQTYMGGVDVHDQLRLQRYSLQLAVRFQKYYKSLFLDFVDLALVNAFIILNHARTAANKSRLSHITFLKQLHLELCQIGDSDWEDLLGSPGQTQHGGQHETQAEGCKVCSLLKDKATGGDTSFQCSTCTLTKKNEKTGEITKTPVYLCNKVKHSYNCQARTCFEIWHLCWNDGANKPSRGKRKLRVRVTDGGEVFDNEGTPRLVPM